MAQQTINVGTAPNDGTGTPLRTAFQYTNSNFSELYTATGPSGNNINVPGSATITGDLTVKTNVLKVDTTNNRVGIGTASPARPLDIVGSFQSTLGWALVGSPAGLGGTTRYIGGAGGTDSWYFNALTGGSHLWAFGESLAMTLNSTGLGLGTAPTSKLTIGTGAYVAGTLSGTSSLYSTVGQGLVVLADGLVVGTRTGSDRFILDTSGNVGIGVVPSAWGAAWAMLQTKGGSFGSNGTNSLYLNNNAYYDGTNWRYIISDYATRTAWLNGQHQWFIAPSGTAGNAITFTQAMTLAASGNLLLGTTTDIAAVRMQVWSTDSNNTAYFRNSNATTPYGPSVKYTAATPNNTSSEFLYCEDSTALRVALRSNGGIANYQANNVSLSDSRMKSDIKPLGSYWAKIKSLELVTFKYKDQTHSDDNIGLIAQQVESVAPELVDVDGFGETPVDGVPLKTIYTTDLYHASIKALQEAMSRIEALEAKLA